MKLTWPLWTLVLLALIGGAVGLDALLSAQGSPGKGAAASGMVGGVATGWLVFGLIRWRSVAWVSRVGRWAAVLWAVGLVIRAAWALDVTWLAVMVGSATGMVMTASLGLWAVRLAMRPGHPILGVARTLIDEAVRLRVAMLFVGLMLVGIPALSLLPGEDRLEYRVQTFLAWSMSLISLLMGIMTVLVAAWSITAEFDRKQVYFTLTKPVARWQYLLGKVVGVSLLNLVLVAVAGLGVYLFAQSMRAQDGWDAADEAAVMDQVLVARIARQPQPADAAMLDRMMMQRVETLRADDPSRYGMPGSSLELVAGADLDEVRGRVLAEWLKVGPGETKTFRFTDLQALAERYRAGREAVDALLARYGFEGDAADEQLAAIQFALIYKQIDLFPGKPVDVLLEELTAEGAKDPRLIQVMTREGKLPLPAVAELISTTYLPPLQLRYQPEAAGNVSDSQVLLGFSAGNRDLGAALVSNDDPHVLRIPVQAISSDGTLDLRVTNLPREGQAQPTISFSYADGMRVLYPIGDFGPNLVRALGIVWSRLVFLSAVALAAGTVLGFSVTVLLASVVYFIAGMSGFLDDSLVDFAAFPREALPLREQASVMWAKFSTRVGEGEYWKAAKIVIGLLGAGFSALVPAFDRFNPQPLIADGLLVPWRMVREAAVWLILVWSGTVGLIGYALLRRREIARVTV